MFEAATLLTGNATVYRMHKVVEKTGFAVFAQKTEEMRAKTTGRHSRFKKSLPVHSMSELQTVFDNDLLWVLEYMELFDGNQHDRLQVCFMMRNNSVHPGAAKMTEPNYHSFCSDIYEYIFCKSQILNY